MKQYFVLTIVLSIMLTSCATINQQHMGVSTLLTTTTISSTPTLATTAQATLSPTTTPAPKSTPLPTATPIPTPTALPIASLTERGVLLIWRDWVQDYLVIDLNENVPPYTIPQNPQCDPTLLPGATKVVCENAAHQIYLLDVLKDSRQDLPIWDTNGFNWSSNGRFLVYVQKVGETKESIFAYDLSKNITQTLAVGLAQIGEGRLSLPTLSADGTSLVVARNFAPWQSRVFEIVRGTSRYRQVGLDEPISTSEIEWSPVARQFVYGATDIKQEIMPRPNYLFFVDMQTGKIRRIAAQTSTFYLDPEWSPTGKQITVIRVGEPPDVCIITVDTAEEVCPSIGYPAWSPTGEHIAFINASQGLIVSKPDVTEAVTLLQNIGETAGQLFWR